MLHTDIEFLYAFSSHGLYLVEIKRLDLGEEAPSSDVYYWLRFNTDDGSIERLEFVSMDTDEGVEVREFADGALSFDNEVGEYLYSNGDGVALDRIGKGSVEKAVKKRFFEYLQSII